MGGTRPGSEGAEEYAMPSGATQFEQVVLTEVRRIGKSVEALAERLEAKFDEVRRDSEARVAALELRVRALEVEAAKVGVKISAAVFLGGLVGAGFAEGIAQLLSHH
jgi:hypothetical protein